MTFPIAKFLHLGISSSDKFFIYIAYKIFPLLNSSSQEFLHLYCI